MPFRIDSYFCLTGCLPNGKPYALPHTLFGPQNLYKTRRESVACHYSELFGRIVQPKEVTTAYRVCPSEAAPAVHVPFVPPRGEPNSSHHHGTDNHGFIVR